MNQNDVRDIDSKLQEAGWRNLRREMVYLWEEKPLLLNKIQNEW